ncbi:MAG: recombination protein O N-terminal domain-containing protein [bacterium]
MSPGGISSEAALLVGSLPRGEADSLVRLFTPGHGALNLLARGLRRPGSKLAGQLKPADELQISAAAGRGGGMLILTGASSRREHRNWQQDLQLLSLYWFMLECSWLASADEGSNADGYRLVVNLLRSEPAAEARCALACVFCIRFLGLHGMLPDLFHDEESGEPLEGDVFCRPSFEGLLDAGVLQRGMPEYGLIRISRERLRSWRRLQSRPLLDYPEEPCGPEDVRLLLEFTRRHVASLAGSSLRSADFMAGQWKLGGATREP